MSSNEMDLTEFLEELGAGVFANKAIRALKETALGVVTYGDKGKSGKVVLTFDMKRIGESNQVALTHSLSYSRPTTRGKISEEDQTETPMHVGVGGRLSLMPDNQTDFFRAKDRDER